MPSARTRKAIVVTGVAAGLLESQPVRGGGGITKVVHHQNFATGGHLVGLSVATHEPGVGCDEHDHRGADEQFFVISGFGIITVAGEQHYVQVGDSVCVPAGVRHSVKAAPAEDEDGPISRGSFELLCALVRAPDHEDDATPWLGVSS